jgi:hypothetical protein
VPGVRVTNEADMTLNSQGWKPRHIVMVAALSFLLGLLVGVLWVS